MLIYLVRHAIAGQHGDPRYSDDAFRPLTTKGRKRFSRAAKRLARRGFEPELVATSPLVRCRQTADVIAQRVCPEPRVVELDSLKPSSQLDALVAWSNEQGIDRLAWVGHAPDVDDMAAALLGARGRTLAFGKGSVAAIQFDEKIVVGSGELLWFVTTKLLGR